MIARAGPAFGVPVDPFVMRNVSAGAGVSRSADAKRNNAGRLLNSARGHLRCGHLRCGGANTYDANTYDANTYDANTYDANTYDANTYDANAIPRPRA